MSVVHTYNNTRGNPSTFRMSNPSQLSLRPHTSSLSTTYLSNSPPQGFVNIDQSVWLLSRLHTHKRNVFLYPLVVSLSLRGYCLLHLLIYLRVGPGLEANTLTKACMLHCYLTLRNLINQIQK